MKILVTAGNTQAPIDQVRCITNIFSGKTGAAIGIKAHQLGHTVKLLTSRPEALSELGFQPESPSWEQQSFRTFADLHDLLKTEVTTGRYDVIIHSAAVSDYLCAGVYAPEAGTAFDNQSQTWKFAAQPLMRDVRCGKVKSSHQELWLRLTAAPKLIDLVRQPWGYQGLLVKFKLEVGVTDTELQHIAERSRVQSRANLMVANTLEGMQDWAIVGARDYQRINRSQLPLALIRLLETHG